MHKLVFVLLIILLISIKSEAQTKPQEPPKKSSKIIVLLRDSSNTLLNKVTKTLFDKGFTIDTKDDVAKTLSTKEFAADHRSIFLKIRASINDTSLVFSGSYAWTLTDGLRPQDFDVIDYRGMKNSAAMHAWKSLDAIARKFGDRIIYSK